MARILTSDLLNAEKCYQFNQSIWLDLALKLVFLYGCFCNKGYFPSRLAWFSDLNEEIFFLTLSMNYVAVLKQTKLQTEINFDFLLNMASNSLKMFHLHYAVSLKI
jgi:hypothetical protein